MATPTPAVGKGAVSKTIGGGSHESFLPWWWAWQTGSSIVTLLSGRGDLVAFTRRPIRVRPSRRHIMYLAGGSLRLPYLSHLRGRHHDPSASCMHHQSRDARQWVALWNAIVPPTIAIIAANAVECPVIFLKSSITTASINVWEEKEGKRGVRGSATLVWLVKPGCASETVWFCFIFVWWYARYLCLCIEIDWREK